MAKKPENRLAISPLSEMYQDLLRIDAHIAGNTIAAQARSLLCAKLLQRSDFRQEALRHLAQKRGISPDELKAQILAGDTAPQ